MTAKNTTKFISAFLLLLIIVPTILFSLPEKAKAVWGFGDVVDSPQADAKDIEKALADKAKLAQATITASSTTTNTGLHFKDIAKQLYQQVLISIGNKLLKKITDSVITWINTGFHGQPLFLENPTSFFTDVVKTQVKTLVDEFGYDLRMFPFGKDWALATIGAYKSTLANNAAYTLNNVMSAPEAANFRANFSVGGWNGFLINTQYPQNNYLGFQMIANENLAFKLKGSIQAPAEKVQSLLQQGEGFLSPQTCPTNEKYNNGYNEFNRPAFDMAKYKQEHKFEPPVDKPTCTGDVSTGLTCVSGKDYTDYVTKWNADLAAARAKWGEKNDCLDKDGKSALVNTTPGSIVANHIKLSLGSGIVETQLAATMGNSISAIVDALLNKFLGDGLNALTSKINPQPSDNWSYAGQTLGLPADPNDPWNSGPDEEVILKNFKILLAGKTIVTKKVIATQGGPNQTLDFAAPMATITVEEVGDTTGVPLRPNEISKVYELGDILRTENEIKLLNNLSPTCKVTDLTNCGVLQLMKFMPEKIQKLDQCLPGPDKNWEKRLEKEKGLASDQFTNGASGTTPDEKETRALDDVKNELNLAVNSFKNWVKEKMMESLPSAILYMDELKKLDDFPQQLKETDDARREKAKTVARLNAIKTNLDLILKQPEPKDPDFLAQSHKLLSLKKQYNALKPSISSTTTIEDTLNNFNTLKDEIENLDNPTTGLIAQCTKEKAGTPDPRGLGEVNKFCADPLVSGYAHGKIISPFHSDKESDTAWVAPANDSGYTFRGPYAKDNPKPGPAPKNDPLYYDGLMLVNAPTPVYGNINCDGLCKTFPSINLPSPLPNLPDPRRLFMTDDRKGVNLECGIIFPSNFQDYVTNE